MLTSGLGGEVEIEADERRAAKTSVGLGLVGAPHTAKAEPGQTKSSEKEKKKTHQHGNISTIPLCHSRHVVRTDGRTDREWFPPEWWKPSDGKSPRVNCCGVNICSSVVEASPGHRCGCIVNVEEAAAEQRVSLCVCVCVCVKKCGTPLESERDPHLFIVSAPLKHSLSVCCSGCDG